VHHDGYFDDHVATTYDSSVAEMFDSAVVGPAVGFLASLAHGWKREPFTSESRTLVAVWEKPAG
jgi:hypothetical protein